MTDHRNLLERSASLLDNARFLTLATRNSEESWAATVNFVPLRSPLRLLWYSLRSARHSRHIIENPQIAASIFMIGLPGLELDGAQLTGTCQPVEDRVADYHQLYYELNFPDETVRAQWLLPLSEFTRDGPRRFYLLTVNRWWLLDIERWRRDKYDTRIEVPNAPHLL
jgi:uncharacterized protein YhbP (UPF0306 family)